jgi:hypothetical protein
LVLEEATLRPRTTEELEEAVKAFCNLRPDGYGLNKNKKTVVLLEFARAMDRQPDWEKIKDQEKRDWYLPVLSFFNSLTSRHQWTMSQINFTVGVRGSISTDQPHMRSFALSLEELGLSSMGIRTTIS